tara:strand:- start:1861 stop:2406 length:546 start_codon:yes stop_codon:yes gene_type:complete
MRYKVNTPPTNIPDERDARLSLFQKKNDKNLFNMIDSENIKLSGSKIKVFKYIKSNDIDDIYMESRQKTISPEPVVVWGHFDPRPIEENLSQFGVEVQYDQVFNFNKSYVENILGSPIEIGDILEPEFQDIKFEVYEVQEDSFEAYGVYHLLVHAKVLRDTQDIHNEDYFNRSDNIGGRPY